MSEKKEGSITKMLKELKSFFVILFLLILTFGSGFLLSDCSAKAKYTELLDRKNHSVEELEVANNKVRSLSSVISDKSEEAEKLKEIITDKNLKIDLEIDGGINFDNCKSAINAGANVLVSGSTIFKQNNGDLKKNISLLRSS